MTTEGSSAAARTRCRVRFTHFDTTSEVGGIDGSTCVVVSVAFTLDQGRGPVPARASVGVDTRQGRRSYEVLDERWARQPALVQAIIDYVRAGERIPPPFRVADDESRRERTVDLDLDVAPGGC